jgi:hypothetical protein
MTSEGIRQPKESFEGKNILILPQSQSRSIGKMINRRSGDEFDGVEGPTTSEGSTEQGGGGPE